MLCCGRRDIRQDGARPQGCKYLQLLVFNFTGLSWFKGSIINARRKQRRFSQDTKCGDFCLQAELNSSGFKLTHQIGKCTQTTLTFSINAGLTCSLFLEK
jgi:hypothetical protein